MLAVQCAASTSSVVNDAKTCNFPNRRDSSEPEVQIEVCSNTFIQSHRQERMAQMKEGGEAYLRYDERQPIEQGPNFVKIHANHEIQTAERSATGQRD